MLQEYRCADLEHVEPFTHRPAFGRSSAMHINEFRYIDAKGSSQREADLRLLLAQPTDKQQRPCPGCDMACSCAKHSPACCCNCSSGCPQAPRMLSSEPDEHPIEPHVLPLVYSLTVARVIQTCWSCQGHVHPNGQIHKLPEVWFYSPSVTYPALLAQHLTKLHTVDELSAPWQVSVAPYSADGTTAMFLIKPELLPEVSEELLNGLQRDLHRIATSLPNHLRRLAQEMLEQLNAA